MRLRQDKNKGRAGAGAGARIVRPRPPGRAFRVALAVSRWNGAVTDGLVEGAFRALGEAEIPASSVTIAEAPGSFELPLLARELARSRRYDAVVCLGAVIRGETDHHRHIAETAARGILLAGLETGVPVGFGVLTCDTAAQARARAGPGSGNKGHEAARAALEMAGILAGLRSGRRKH